MAFSEFEQEMFKEETRRFIESRRPPVEMRDKLDLGFKLENQSIILFEVRPCRNNPVEKLQHPFAKATYVKAGPGWKVYWRRADLKWQRYEPAPVALRLSHFLETVDKDKHCCFWG